MYLFFKLIHLKVNMCNWIDSFLDKNNKLTFIEEDDYDKKLYSFEFIHENHNLVGIVYNDYVHYKLENNGPLFSNL